MSWSEMKPSRHSSVAIFQTFFLFLIPSLGTLVERSPYFHQDPFPCAALVFKNRLLGLANFPEGKIM